VRISFAALAASVCLLASDADRIRELNAQIQSELKVKQPRRSAASDAAFRERASLLGDLIVSDPTTARSLLLPPHALAEIRSRQTTPASLLERPLAYMGSVETSVADMPNARRSEYRYSFQSGDDLIEAFGGPTISIRCGDQASLEGFRLGDKIVVTAAAVERSADVPAECKTEGIQKIAVILANYPGVPTPPSDQSRCRGNALRSDG
jgi:hypothetical protein